MPMRLFGHISSNSLFHVRSPRWIARNFPNVTKVPTDMRVFGVVLVPA